VGISLMGFAVTAASAASPAPDPVAWQPASIAGPALFVGEVARVEEFRNPPGVDYACHAVTSGSHKDSSHCMSNACGLERTTLKVEQSIQGSARPEVSLNSVLGEWCAGVSVTGRRFLIAVLPDGNWSAFEVIKDAGRALVLPDVTGCLGRVDIPMLLQTAGIDVDSAMSPTMDWREKWTPMVGADCPRWMPESLDKKALPIATVIDAWKTKY
jgi:hypothetical protein